jgi:hypothetical protein
MDFNTGRYVDEVEDEVELSNRDEQPVERSAWQKISKFIEANIA